MIDPAEFQPKPITSAHASKEEEQIERTLRPQSLEAFIGQGKLKENLSISIEAAKSRNEPIEHVLFYGNPGLGKTTLAHILAKEIGAQIRVTSGPSLERVGDLAAILSNLGAGDVLFIDEIHRMNKTIEEVLYPAMEDFALDIIVGKGPTARTMRLNLEPFTIIGATTRLSLLSSPLRDRFGMIHELRFYEDDEIEAILNQNASRLEIDMHPDAKSRIAKRARKTPRIANRLLRRVRDYAQVKGDGSITDMIASDALAMLDIDELGLDAADRHILETIMQKFAGGPVGLTSIAAASQQEVQTIEDVIEPFLLQLGLLQRTARGRITTKAAYDHLNQSQDRLI